ncbi:uncharacterized protein LOC127867057 [Dreissena polymorpha]|uniref:uncharacterized protein LOC127867057 n=1 Tax=Dreissena polymorpha TaxID=45954 RepID=UPI002264B49F|nr:uncharacterized protein LOC127867057 [Dreissena polymorpha]
MWVILIVSFIFMETGANSVTIQLNETYNYTSVELACSYQSDTEVSVGYYQKLPFEKSFGRKIAISRNIGNCTITSLPNNILCRCVTNKHVSCTINNLTTANEAEEWKCAIPNTTGAVGIFSNVARISLQYTKTTASTESTESINESTFKTIWSTESDISIGNVGETKPFTDDRTRIVVFISSVLGSLIMVVAITVPLSIRCRKSWVPSSGHLPTVKESGPLSMVHNTTLQRFVDTADVRSLDSCYYIGCIAGTASQSATHVVNSEANVEDGTNTTEDTYQYSEIQEDPNSVPNSLSLQKDPFSKHLQNVTPTDKAHYTDTIKCSSQTDHCISFNTYTFAKNQCLFAEFVPNRGAANKGVNRNCITRMTNDDEIAYAECTENMMPVERAENFSSIETAEKKKLEDNIYLTAIYSPVPERLENDGEL